MSAVVRFIKGLGPGILFASMAIGTSHLVLSTKAGAQYGWVMVIPIVLANLLKYPFFEFGVRYTNITRQSLVQGYVDLGKGYLWLYTAITFISTFTILAALYIVTAGLLANLFNLSHLGLGAIALALFIGISLLLIIGKYKVLERSLKIIISILFISLLVTTILVFYKGSAPMLPEFTPPTVFNEMGVLFLIGLMGWMPTAVEASGWVSLWGIEKMEADGTVPPLKKALSEFNLGYVITAVLAIFFMVIGWKTLYGTGIILSDKAVPFADQVVSLFTAHIGQWAYPLIALAAFATMFSTCMTAHDAIARIGIDVFHKLKLTPRTHARQKEFAIAVLLLAVVNWAVITLLGNHMGNLVALATFVSFVFAPLLGWMNLKTVMGPSIPTAHRPNRSMRWLTYIGIVFLTLFALYYCWLLWV
ncbi:MAG: divalent metal cation transporter [Bacteroidota bacterium]